MLEIGNKQGVRRPYSRSRELEEREKQAPVLRGGALLDIQLREGHKHAVRQADEESACVEGTDVFRGHHDDISYRAQHTGYPERALPAELDRDEAGSARADEGAERHQRGDELLAGGIDIPADGRGSRMPVDLHRNP